MVNRDVIRQTPRGWPQYILRVWRKAVLSLPNNCSLLRGRSRLAIESYRKGTPGPVTWAAHSWLGVTWFMRPHNKAYAETLHHQVEMACAKSGSSRSQRNNTVTCADGSGSHDTFFCYIAIFPSFSARFLWRSPCEQMTEEVSGLQIVFSNVLAI